MLSSHYKSGMKRQKNGSKSIESFMVTKFGRCVRMVAAAEKDTVGYSGDAVNLIQRRGKPPPNDA